MGINAHRKAWAGIAPFILVIGLGGCTSELTAALFDPEGGLSKLEAVQKAVAKGEEISDAGAEKLAIAFDKYCTGLPGVTDAVRGYVRLKVNGKLAELDSRYRAPDFCQRVE